MKTLNNFKNRKMKIPLMIVSALGLSFFSLPSMAVFGVGDTVIVTNCQSQVDMAGSVFPICASEGSVAATYNYLSSGRLAPGLGMLNASEGLIAQVKNLNSEGAHSVENQRQQTPNEDLAARYRELQKKYLEAVDSKTRPLSASACREATIAGGLGGGGGSGGAGAATTKGQDDMAGEATADVLTPKSENSYKGQLLFSPNAHLYCTQADATNKMPNCTAVGALAGKNLAPTSLLMGAVGSGEKTNYSVDFKPADRQYRTMLDYIVMVRPTPAPDLASKAKDTPAGKIYLAEQRRYNSRVMAVTYGITAVAALSAKMSENNMYVTQVWNAAEVNEDYKDVYGDSLKKPDRPSERELMHFMVSRQFGTRLSAADGKGDEITLARRNVEVAKLNAYLLLKLNTQQEWTNILLSNILSQSVDPITRPDLQNKANGASSSGGLAK